MACIPFISWPDDMTMHDYSEIRLFNWQHTCNMFFVKKIMPLMCNFIVYRVSLFDLWIKLRFRSRCFKLTRNAEKIRTFFYDIFYTKKTWNQRVLMLIISPFILDDHFLQGIIKNLSWRCKQVSEMQNEDALLSCTTLQYTRLEGVSLNARFMLINLASGFSLSAERFHVWDFGREKKNQGVKYGLFLSMTQMGFVSFLTWLSTFGNF